jgi:hypothetical protein
MKKLSTALLSLALLFVLHETCTAQAGPKPQLIDTINETTCEIVMLRLDMFIVALRDDPGSAGYVVIYGKKGDIRGGLTFETLARAQFAFRHIGSDKVVIKRGEEREKLTVELWLVPARALPPVLNEARWNFTIPEQKPSYLFATSGYQDDCSYGFEFKKNQFAEFLVANPAIRGNIVIRARSVREFKKERQNLAAGFSASQISSRRLRYFYENNIIPATELWLINRRAAARR